jgi:hypothetical protein
VAGGGRQEARAGLRRQELDRLHRHRDQPEAPLAEVEARGVSLHRLDVEPLGSGALGQRRQQQRLGVERGDGVAGVGEPERDAAAAGTDLEDRPRGLARQPAPERQVDPVAAALDVMPDHDGGRRPGQRRRRKGSQVAAAGHRQYSSAWPRSASSSRSSSSAV